MSLYTRGGNLLLRDGKLAAHVDCCCPQCEDCAAIWAITTHVVLTVSGFVDYDYTFYSACWCHGTFGGTEILGDQVRHHTCSNLNGSYTIDLSEELVPGILYCGTLVVSEDPCDGPLLVTSTCVGTHPPCRIEDANTATVRSYLHSVGLCVTCSGDGFVTTNLPDFRENACMYVDGVLVPPSSSAFAGSCCFGGGAVPVPPVWTYDEWCRGVPKSISYPQLDCGLEEVGTVTYTFNPGVPLA